MNPTPGGWQFDARSFPPGSPPRWIEGRRVLGVGVVNELRDHGKDGHVRVFMIHLPHAHAVGAAAILPLAWAVRRWRRPPPVGRCRRCGYDVRATPDRCPECGTLSAPAAAS